MSLYLGIDIGGTNTELGIVDEEGQIVSSQTLSTKQCGSFFTDYIEALSQQIAQMIANPALTDRVVGIGVGAQDCLSS